MIPTITAYRKSDNAKIINILMTCKQFSKQKKNFELTKATRNWTQSTKEHFFFDRNFYKKKKNTESKCGLTAYKVDSATLVHFLAKLFVNMINLFVKLCTPKLRKAE